MLACTLAHSTGHCHRHRQHHGSRSSTARTVEVEAAVVAVLVV